mgnify:FL=1
MAIDRVLARGWKFEINDNGDWKEIGGLNSFAWGGTKTDADTTGFDSQGWSEHLPVQRGRTLTLQGSYLEVPKENGQFIARIKVLTGAVTASGNVTVTLNKGVAENIIVAVVKDDTVRTVATKIAQEIDEDTDWSAYSIGDTVTVKHTSGEAFTVSFADTNTTGVTVKSAVTGDRDEGQEAVDALCTKIGADSIAQFKKTSPGGKAETFYASAEMGDIGGGNNDTTSWGVTLTISGKVTQL